MCSSTWRISPWSAGCVVSKVVISKETPLYDPAKVYRAAIESAKVPGRPGSAIDEIAESVQFESSRYAELYHWAHKEEVPVDSRFGATLFLYEHVRGDAEFADRIVRFWAGDPLPVPDLRRRLKETGAAATYRLARINERDLARQRFRFVSRLMQAAGHPGWVILLDEVELIGRYTIAAAGQVLRRDRPMGPGRARRPGGTDLRRADHRR